LARAESTYVEFTPDRCAEQNLTFYHINSFPEQAIRAPHQNTGNEFIASNVPQADRTY
jgi:hypothetical protein